MADTRRVVEKIVALGGEPVTAAAPWVSPTMRSRQSVGSWSREREIIAELHAVIPKAGGEPRSEALEHFVEHLISRKQEQVDQLLRALGEAE